MPTYTRRVTAVVPALLALLAVAPVAAQVELPRDVEIELALSALPAHLREGAAVYVFERPHGFVLAREGTNGFRTLVSRVEPAVFRGDWEYVEHPDDILLPIAFDAAGVGGPMQSFVDAAELLARGTGPAEMKRIMRDRFDSGQYRPAERVGVAFMLAPVMRAYPDPVRSSRVYTLNVPHRMFYAPRVTNEDIGGIGGSATQPFIIQAGVHGYIGQRAGPAEVEAINREHAELIARLCAIDTRWCLRNRS